MSKREVTIDNIKSLI